jgi:hypothetical protein
MEHEGEPSGPRRRTWAVILGGAWVLLGIWSISAGQVWLGVAQLVLGALNVLVLVSARVAAWNQAPLFRRK